MARLEGPDGGGVMASHTALGHRFFMGTTSDSASNVEIIKDEFDGAMLVGYGHAVYAYRFPDGTTLGFMGWSDPENVRQHAGSKTTVQHYRKLRIEVESEFLVEGTGQNAAPKRTGFDPERWSRYLWQHHRVNVPLTDFDE